ncbi:MAG: Wzz/FepE/Etk N-terminal domain-containing protein [Woeseiaceae bacterium]|jgi:uncharacterized protein involved in exopolysaccharide biosynthesis|nr:Wzz/FepE/Etk N-terminal domain-containing protein [Woeseiaceae bacterium]
MSAGISGEQDLPRQASQNFVDDELRLAELWSIVWRGKWRIVAITFVFSMLSVSYALFATEWYRAEVLLAPAEGRDVSPIQGQLGGLAALAGMSLGGGDSVDAIATLTSREFARDFINDEGLLPVLFPEEWDPEEERWLATDTDDQPDIRDAVRRFHENILRVDEDRATGLVTVAVEWTDPDMAAEWASLLVQRLNSKLRDQTLKEAETNVAYLQGEMQKTNVVTLQQAVGRLVESELQKLMLARGTEEFAFRTIDPAQPPDRRIRPKRSLIVVVGTLLGGFIALIWVFVAQALRP